MRILITGAAGPIAFRMINLILSETFPQEVEFMLAQYREGETPVFFNTGERESVYKNLEDAGPEWWHDMQTTYNIDYIVYLESTENENIYEPTHDYIQRLESSDGNFVKYLRNSVSYPIPVGDEQLKISFISTDKIYTNDEFPHELNPMLIEQPEGNPIENTPFAIYTAQKIQTELALTGVPDISLRIIRAISIVCGEQGNDFPLTKLIFDAVQDNALNVLGDGLRGMNFTEVMDLAVFLGHPNLFDPDVELKLISRIINFSRFLNYTPERYLVDKIKNKIESDSNLILNSTIDNFPYVCKTPQVENMQLIYSALIPIEIIIENIRDGINPVSTYDPLVINNVAYLDDGVLVINGTSEPISIVAVSLDVGLMLSVETSPDGTWAVKTQSPIIYSDVIQGIAHATTSEATQYQTVMFEVQPFADVGAG